MCIKVLGISTSPRIKGNSDLLLRRALQGAESTGANTEYVHLADYKIGPCIECNYCYSSGICVLNDDYPKLLEKLLSIDRLIFATPIFFMNVCAQAKILIDRGQCLWVRKYILKKELISPERNRRAMAIAVGGSKSMKQLDCVRLTMKAYFDSLQTKYTCGLYVNKIDARGDITTHPSALDEAYRLGALLADTSLASGSKPVEIELT